VTIVKILAAHHAMQASIWINKQYLATFALHVQAIVNLASVQVFVINATVTCFGILNPTVARTVMSIAQIADPLDAMIVNQAFSRIIIPVLVRLVVAVVVFLAWK